MSQLMTYEDLSATWQDVYSSLPPLCTRKNIFEVAGVPVGTLANCDCRGEGIVGKKMLGKTVVYPRLEAVAWLMRLAGESPEVSV